MVRKNIGKFDMFIRLLIGILLIAIAFSFNYGIIQILLATFGVIVLLTGIFNYCPFYTLLSFSTRQNKIDKITSLDIKKAIKDYKVEEKTPKNNKVEVSLNNQKILNNEGLIEKKEQKKTTKKATKKTTKKTVKKVAKKTSKKTAKKTTKKATKKVAN